MKSIFTLLFVICAITTMAQDVIVKKDGNTILAKVTKVGDIEVEYHKFNSTSNRLYSIGKSEIIRINYEDGEQDEFNSMPEKIPQTLEYAVGIDNEQLISTYNNITEYQDITANNNVAKCYLATLGVSQDSQLSSEEIEISFRNEGMPNYIAVEILNKTNHTIYIDNANSFEVLNNGACLSYYKAQQTSVTEVHGAGIGLNVGSVAGLLGIGGTINSMLNGVSVSTGNGLATTVTTIEQRVLPIPSGVSIVLRSSASFIEDFKVKKGLKIGQVVNYPNLRNSIYKRRYIITYSNDEHFSRYNTMQACLYLKSIIGSKIFCYYSDKKFGPRYIKNYQKNTIVLSGVAVK